MKALFSPRGYSLAKMLCVLFLVATVAIGMIGCNDDVDPPVDLEIHNWNDLNEVRNNLGGNHRLMNDLDSTTDGYEGLAGPSADGGQGWVPIGTPIRPFTGSFDGQGFEIRDLVIDRPEEVSVGLFSVTSEAAVIENLAIVNATVSGYILTGGLVAANFGLIANACFSGNVTGYDHVGGLVGSNLGGTLNTSYSSGSVSGETGEEARGRIGGLAGNSTGTISNCYSTASATGNQYVGGLVGGISSGTVENSYATGNVTGEDNLGGLVGRAIESTVSDSFWDKETSGIEVSDGGAGKTTAEMMNIATFTNAGWDIVLEENYVDETWYIDDGNDYPRFGWQSAG